MASPFFKQLFACFATLNLYFLHGYVLGMMSLIRHKPTADRLPNELSADQENCLSITFLSSLAASQIFCGFLADIVGRKFILLPSAVPVLLTYYLLLDVKCSADYYFTLLVACTIAGLIGGALSIGSTMVAEICSPKYRGALLGLQVFLQILGTTIAHYLDGLYAVNIGVVFLCLSFSGVVCTIVTPESPVWLACMMRFKECTTAFRWLRGDRDTMELTILMRSQEKSLMNKQSGKFYVKPTFFYKDNLLRAFVLSVHLVICVEVSSYFLGDTVNDVQHIYKSALLFNVTKLLSVGTGVLVLTKIKRRYFLFCLGAAATCLLVTIVIVLFIISTDDTRALCEYTRLPKYLYHLYVPLVNFGIVPVSFILLNELYPLAFRGTGVVLTSSVQGAVRAILTFKGAHILKSHKSRGVFAVSTMLIMISLIYLYKFLPETSNKTLRCIDLELKPDINETCKVNSNIDVREKMLKSPYPLSPAILMNQNVNLYV